MTNTVNKDINLQQGDCLELMNGIEDSSIDLICCDLPYQITACKWDVIIPFDKLWEQYKRIIKSEGVIVLTAAQPFTSALIISNIEMFKYVWYWRKNRATNVLNAKKMPLRDTEEIYVFGGRIYNPQGLIYKPEPSRNSKRDSENYGTGTTKSYIREYTNYPKQTLEFDVVQRAVHPTEKPVKLFEYLVKTYTNEGMIVLDNCMGSGTTGVACINTNRKFIGMEKDENYFSIAKERIESALAARDEIVKIDFEKV